MIVTTRFNTGSNFIHVIPGAVNNTLTIAVTYLLTYLLTY
jgi:hypothetical protein